MGRPSTNSRVKKAGLLEMEKIEQDIKSKRKLSKKRIRNGRLKTRDKNSRKGKRYTEEEKTIILFWWVYCDENAYRTGQIVSKKLNRPVASKVIIQMANRENFHTLAPFIKRTVEEYKRKEKIDITEEQLQYVKIGTDMLEMDWLLIRQAKAYMSGRNSDLRGNRFKSVKEVIEACRFVQENTIKMFGDTNLRQHAWDYTKETEGGRLMVSAQVLLDQLSKSEENEIINSIEEKIIKGEL